MPEYGFDVITSTSNSNIKFIKALQMKKYRDEYGLFTAEGIKLVDEALASGHKLKYLLLAKANADLTEKYRGQAERKGIQLLITADHVFDSISDTKTPQGVMAVIHKKHYDLDTVLGGPEGFLVLLDGISDPGNLGTIIRTVDAAGGTGVVLLNGCTDPYGPKAVRSTMGSIFRVPVYESDDAADLVIRLRKASYHIAASHLAGSDVFRWKGGGPKTALVIGNESRGVSRQLIELADSLIKIPMAGGAESLNASVAAGILIYEIYRKGIKMDMLSLE